MEAAAKAINSLSQRVLPDQPHHLSHLPDWRYKPHEDKRPDRPEEWGNTRLQYMTLISDAERGVLLTRPYYDMREELQKPVPMQVSALASKGGEKKKLSLSDYKNKKTTGPNSASPPEPAIAKRRESEASNTSAPYNVPSPRIAGDSRNPRANNGTDRPPQAPSLSSVESRLPPKPSKHPLPPRPPTPESRKRTSGIDEDSRQPKRPRPESDRLPVDKSRGLRDEPPRRRDPGYDGVPRRDVRSAGAPALSNGRGLLKDASGPSRSDSPAAHSHSRNNSLNGIRSAVGSHRNTPLKPDTTSKAYVPPLLSPLHFDDPEFDDRRDKKSIARDRDRERDRERDRDKEREREKDRERERERQRQKERDMEREREAERAKRREREERDREREKEQRNRERDRERDRTREPTIDTGKSHKARRPDEDVKIERSPPRLPPLLSPTLPPEVEDAYEQWHKKQPSSSSDDARLPPPAKEARKGLAPPAESHENKKSPYDMTDDDLPDPKPPIKRRLMARLKIPKRLRKSISQYLKMAESDRQRQRSAEPPSAVPARKRPISSEEAPVNDYVSAKRHRAVEPAASSLLQAPATPSKKTSTAMSRVSSTNSHANTPGDTHHTSASGAAATSAPAGHGSGDHASANSNGVRPQPPKISPADQARAERLKVREGGYLTLGKKLKHAGEALVRSERKSDHRLGCVTYLEGIMAFAMAFHVQMGHCTIRKRDTNPMVWRSLFPMVKAFRGEHLRKISPAAGATLHCFLLILHACAVDETLKACTTSSTPAAGAEDLLGLVKEKTRLLANVREMMHEHAGGGPSGQNKDDRRGGILKGVELNIWMGVDDVCEMGLRIMKRWCADEGVEWTAEVNTSRH